MNSNGVDRPGESQEAMGGKKNLEACLEVFCSNFHGLAKLEFETCIEACL